jgi:catechol 2,3-dioxygenase-like lactoylglutathione lyase family enzyme
MRLAQALLFVKDLPRMRRFYSDVLGLTIVDDREDAAQLDAGGVILLLHAIPAKHAASIVISDPPKARSDTPVKLIFHVDDVRGTRERLLAGGAQTRELATLDDGRMTCDCLDLEGNVFRIANG